MEEPGRRAQYRVSIDDATGLKVSLLNQSGPPCMGRLLDVSGMGAGVLFVSPSIPNLAVGQEVDLVFTSGTLAESMTVAARVQHRTEEQEGSRRFGFRFLQTQEIDAQLPPAMREFFNRRRSVRVTPEADRPVRASLIVGEYGELVDARVRNISETGIGISLEAALESKFADVTAVALSLHLPDARHPMNLMGNIRYRRLVGTGVLYGIDFDAEQSRNYDRKQRMITKYVLKRELQSLRQSA
jgi:c-di-GMP-binding flagellar brake protein YcgR